MNPPECDIPQACAEAVRNGGYLIMACAEFQERRLCVAVLVVEVTCRWCSLVFCVCRSCWRGQAYCCDSCRKEARRRSHSAAQKRYRSTFKGREAHRLAQRRRRMGRVKKTVDDQPSTPAGIGLIVLHTRRGCCCFCGREGVIVECFPRRGYGHGRHAHAQGDKDGRCGRDATSHG